MSRYAAAPSGTGAPCRTAYYTEARGSTGGNALCANRFTGIEAGRAARYTAAAVEAVGYTEVSTIRWADEDIDRVARR